MAVSFSEKLPKEIKDQLNERIGACESSTQISHWLAMEGFSVTPYQVRYYAKDLRIERTPAAIEPLYWEGSTELDEAEANLRVLQDTVAELRYDFSRRRDPRQARLIGELSKQIQQALQWKADRLAKGEEETDTNLTFTYRVVEGQKDG